MKRTSMRSSSAGLSLKPRAICNEERRSDRCGRAVDVLLQANMSEAPRVPILYMKPSLPKGSVRELPCAS